MFLGLGFQGETPAGNFDSDLKFGRNSDRIGSEYRRYIALNLILRGGNGALQNETQKFQLPTKYGEVPLFMFSSGSSTESGREVHYVITPTW